MLRNAVLVVIVAAWTVTFAEQIEVRRGAANCGPGCHCSPLGFPETADCTQLELEIIPHDLPPTVAKVDFDGNQIHAVEVILNQYRRLTHLGLSHNRISHFQPRCFNDLRQLAFLDLSHNRISTVPSRAFIGLASLKEISLSHNLLERLDDHLFANSPFLEHVNLANNRLVTLPTSLFVNVRNLQILNLADNSLKSVPSGVFHATEHLSSLDLSNNELEKLTSGVFSHLRKLVFLNLSGCKLAYIPSDLFKPMSERLHFLDLSGNHLQSVPGRSLSSLRNLKSLSIGLNYMNTLDGIRSLESLTSITVRGCHKDAGFLTLTSDTFVGNSRLEGINVTNCPGLWQLPETVFKGLPFLKRLNLKGNSLTTVTENMADWNSLEYIDLTGNPLMCSCQLAWLNQLLSTTRMTMPRPRCASPPDLAGQQLGYISFQDLECDEADFEAGRKGRSTGKIVAFSVLAIIILIIVLVIILFAFNKFLKYRRESHAKEAGGNRAETEKKKKKKHRFPKLKGKMIDKSQIEVVPEKLPDNTSSKYIDVKVAEEHEAEDNLDEHVYEELPLGPKSNYPDIKISVL